MSLSDFSDLSQVIIASANLFLAAYLLLYQLRKDKKTDSETARLNEQNIKLQWFKELVIQPNIPAINSFYSNLSTIKSLLTTDDISISQKEQINDFIKNEMSTLRKVVVDVMLGIDKPFYDELLENIDELTDDLTNSIFNDDLKLNRESVYEKQIGSKISYSKNKLIAQLYNYKGIASPQAPVKSSAQHPYSIVISQLFGRGKRH